jgi:hypothetical protein
MRGVKFGTLLIGLAVACAWSGSSRAGDYVDPERVECQALIDRLSATQIEIGARGRQLKTSEQRCAHLRRAVLPAVERAIRTIETAPVCRDKLANGMVTQARARIDTVRQRVAKRCGARA